jgi:CheY-like chemotaxis protein
MPAPEHRAAAAPVAPGVGVAALRQLAPGTRARRPLDRFARLSYDQALPETAEKPAEQIRILIIDDEAMMCRLISRMLRPYSCDIVNNGREALDKVNEAGDYDLILCDVMMPELSGPEFVSRLGVSHPELQKRVIFITGGTFRDEARDQLERFENLVLEKPFTRNELCNAVNDHLGRS